MYFQFNRGEVFTDPDSGESNLREAFIHETGHNILEQYGGLFYKDIEGEIPQDTRIYMSFLLNYLKWPILGMCISRR